MTNADRICFDIGMETYKALKSNKKEAPTLIRNAMAVLQEMGIYSSILFLTSRNSNLVDNLIKQYLVLLRHEDLLNLTALNHAQPESIQQNISSAFGDNAHTVYLANRYLERMLTYALFLFKSYDNGSQNDGGRS